MKVLGIFRDERFSPNSIQKDRDILLEVMGLLHGGQTIGERELEEVDEQFDLILNMGRLPGTMRWLKRQEERGARVLNPARGVENCRRSRVVEIMKQNNIPAPDRDGDAGWWIKRGDAAAQSADDVRYCPDRAALDRAEDDFAARGITELVVQAHVKGDLIKFYGAGGTGFFRTFYPGDDGISKFGKEEVNGRPHHYPYDKEELAQTAGRLAQMLDTPIFGGDAIVDSAGRFFVIDFNDWPSFSRCRVEAARAIAELAEHSMNENK